MTWHSFANHLETMATQAPDALTTGLAQYGVRRESVATAIGRVLTRSTWQNSTRLEHADLAYDGLGQQTKMIRYQNAASPANPVEWSWQFDSVGQLLALTEPSSTPQSRIYSNWGELLQVKWKPAAPEPAHSIMKSYDALGRLLHTEEQNDGTTDAATVSDYRYDFPGQSPLLNPSYVLGRLASAQAPTGDVVLSYDAFGRVNARSFTGSDKNVYGQRHKFHGDGSQAWIELSLPDNNYRPERVEYAYDTAGQPRSIWFSDGQNMEHLYQAKDVDVWGRLGLAMLGRKLEYRATYANTGRRLPQDVKASNGTEARYIAFTGFDPVGRELSRSEDTPDSAGNHTFSYDAIGRLNSATRAQAATTAAQWSFAYDPLGSVTVLNDQLGGADATLSYLSTDRDRICRIGYGNGGLGGTACNVAYDSFGNIVEEPTRTGYNRLEYFNSGDVRSIQNQSGAKATIRYGPFGEVQELDIVAATQFRSDRHYGAFITQRTQKGANFSTAYLSRQFPGPGLAIGRRGPQGKWIFQFPESRGTRFTTDEEGNFVQDLAYAPYGEAASKGAEPGVAEFSTEQWNKGDALDQFGLVQLGARIYEPVIGRFMSRDPLLIPRTSATSNPYAFAVNDPINLSDPAGLDPCAYSSSCSIWASYDPTGSTGSGIVGSAIVGGLWLLDHMFGGAPGGATPVSPADLRVSANPFNPFAGMINAYYPRNDEHINSEPELPGPFGWWERTRAEILVRSKWSREKNLYYEAMNLPILGEFFMGGVDLRTGERGAGGHLARGFFGLGMMWVGARMGAPEATRGGNGLSYASKVEEGGTGDAFAGHGEIRDRMGTTTIPRGTTLTVWTHEGGTIGDVSVGGLIEAGQYDRIPLAEGARSYLPGAEVRDYVLKAPTGLRVFRMSRTVEDATPLSELLTENMGHCQWAACLSFRR